MKRQFIFKHYALLALLVAGLSVAIILFFYKEGRMPLIGSVLATILTFCYFIQQQRLSEATLFKSLFTEFNSRYNELNGRLTAIALHDADLSPEQRETVIDYFNLCAEEYLFYEEGYIHKVVWKSWCNGMLLYLQKEPFSSIWNEEKRTNSYYGLSLDQIRKGAA
jgi:hypothetical protein